MRYSREPQLHTTSSAPVHLSEADVYVHAVDHYEVIDPELPVPQRYRTHFWTLDFIAHDGGGEQTLTMRCTPDEMVELAAVLLNTAILARVTPRGEGNDGG